MVDLHTHILPQMDDGAKSEAMALEMLRMAREDGTSHILLTPHYIDGEMNNGLHRVLEQVESLAQKGREAGIDISVYPGSEVFIHPNLPQWVEEEKICTLNRSSYILVELPMRSVPLYAEEVFFQLMLRGVTPILAHPERYHEVLRNPNLIYKLLSKGVLAQLNAGSLTGLYGSKVQECAWTLLRHGMAHFIASDAHSPGGRSPKLAKAKALVCREMGETVADRLFKANGLAVIHNQTIERLEPKPVAPRKKFFFPFMRKAVTGVPR